MSGVRIIIRNPPGGDLIELGNQYIYRGGWEVVQHAEEGSGGRSTLLLDDPDLSLWDNLGLNIGGRQQIRLVDIDSDRIVHFGFVGTRRIRRKYDDKGQPVGRAWSVDIWDVNSILQRRILTHKGADRPRESDVDRIMALLDLPEWGIIDTFFIGPSTTTMSEHDYRGMSVGQYIADCAQMSRKNWWADVVYIDGSDQQTFWYGRDTREAYYSTLSISNDLDDIDLAALRAGTATIYPPAKDTEYSMDPERVYDGIWATGEKESIYRRRPATAEVFGLRWDTAMQWPTIHEHDRLVHKAESMLDRLKDEQEIVTTAIDVPADMAHLVRAGMRMSVKLTHIDSMAEFTDCRILSRGLSPRGDGRRYHIPLTLEPVGPGEPDPECLTVDETAVEVTTGGSVRFEWDTAPTVGQFMVSLKAGRNPADSAHAPMSATIPAGVSIPATEWVYEGSDAHDPSGRSVEAASREADSDDTAWFDWLNLNGSDRPVAIALKFNNATGVTDVFTESGIDDIDMGISGMVITEPGILVFMFDIAGFDQPPHIMTSPSGDGVTLMVDGYARVGFPDSDWITGGYQIIPEAGTYDLEWHASNTYGGWSWEAIAVFVTGEICGSEASCSTAVGSLVAEEASDQAYASATTSVTITPESGVNSIILAMALANNKNVPTDTDMTDTSAATQMYTENVPSGHPTANAVYLASDGSGSSTITSEYTPGFNAAVVSHWSAVAVAIQTSATAPVQFKTATDDPTASVTLDDAPMVGNLLVMQVALRSNASIDPGTGVVPGSGFWTVKAEASALSVGGTSTDVCGILTHCVETGDDEGPYGVVAESIVCVSEWEITE